MGHTVPWVGTHGYRYVSATRFDVWPHGAVRPSEVCVTATRFYGLETMVDAHTVGFTHGYRYISATRFLSPSLFHGTSRPS